MVEQFFLPLPPVDTMRPEPGLRNHPPPRSRIQPEAHLPQIPKFQARGPAGDAAERTALVRTAGGPAAEAAHHGLTTAVLLAGQGRLQLLDSRNPECIVAPPYDRPHV